MRSRGFWANFAEVPGAIILLLLTIFQLNIVSYTQREEMVSRSMHLENIIVSLCVRINNLEVVTSQTHRKDLPRRCKFYDEVEARSKSKLHWTWVEAGEIFYWVQLVMFLVGAIGFIAGISYRIIRIEAGN